MASRFRSIDNTPGINFVSISLEVALLFCRLANDGDQYHLPIYLSKAQNAYDIAVRYMFSLDKSAKQFDAITANADRVKLMLQSLHARNASSSPAVEPMSQPGAGEHPAL